MWRELLGLERKAVAAPGRTNSLLEVIQPRRGFGEVILPPETRDQLYQALTQIEKHRLIFSGWGLGERHPTGLGLVFNFAGPPGTGKTICAEAVAFSLGKKLLRVSYAELESCWAGETGKNIRSVFREARTLDAVLFFDEADSVAARRFTGMASGYEREANQAVNILLKELEEYDGVVIFATNLAANFDPAFERRLRTHILFRLPTAAERQRIWKVQLHPEKTPLADDVDFADLAERYEASGGDIRNAVLKAAQLAAGEEGDDSVKRIHQRHFAQAIEQVLDAKLVMSQNSVGGFSLLQQWEALGQGMECRFAAVQEELERFREELGQLAEAQTATDGLTAGLSALVEGDRAETRTRLEGLDGRLGEVRRSLDELQAGQTAALERSRTEQEEALARLEERLASQESSLRRATLLPWPRQAVLTAGAAASLLLVFLGALAGHFLWP